MNSFEIEFQQAVLNYYYKCGRHDLPWRKERSPFNVFLSEIMLQQTQVPRVVEKFKLFRSQFSSFEDLAKAPQSKILTLWQGLGYNRRAVFLHRACQIITEDFAGVLPNSPEVLILLPGIGLATAASITVYAYNKCIPYIETNVRAVYIHHFFQDRTDVSDKEIFPLVAKTIYSQNPYDWYSALMDYGTMLKSEYKNPSRKSKHHTKQSTFHGSRRQLRGKIIRTLSELGSVKTIKLERFLRDSRSRSVIDDLIREVMVEERNGSLFLK